MADQRHPNKYPPLDRRLPSFTSLSGTMESPPQIRRISMHEEHSDDNSQSLRRQLDVRDQIIASLRTEQSRTQAICDRLDTKSQVMDRELSTLVEEKTELRKQVSSLSIQVEKLTRDKEALQNQSQADAAQWRQIMSMSSKLQMQSVEETRHFNSEREAWARERKDLESRLGLSSAPSGGSAALQRIDTSEGSDVSTSLETPHRTLSLTSVPEEQIQLEINALRERCRELEESLSSILKESASIERAGNLIREARRRLGASCEAGDDSERKRVRS